MKLHRLILIGLLAVSLPALSAPSIFKSKKKKDLTPVTATAENTSPNLSDPEKVAALRETLEGEWSIISVGNTTIEVVDEMPYLNFAVGSGRFYANNGCNVINGVFTISEHARLTLNSVMSTMKYCPDAVSEGAISAVLSDGKVLTPKIERIGQDSYLRLADDKGTTLMTLRRHNMEFLNGNWKITTVRGAELSPEADDVTVFFDIPALKIHGNTGCNFFNGTLFIDPSRTNALDISNLGLTRRGCPFFQQEQAIMLALEETATAIQGSHEQAMLLDDSGNTLMTLERLPAGTDTEE